MVIGILQFELVIRGSESLKDKRSVVRSVKDRLHREHMVSVAEVGALDNWSLAIMGLACVGTEGARVGEVLDHIINKLQGLTVAELGSTDRRLIHGEAAFPDHNPEPANDADLRRELIDYFNASPRPREDQP